MGVAPDDVAIYAHAAGFTGYDRTGALVTAVAVAMAETGGTLDANAHCLDCVPGIHEDSRGLWQINVIAHPDMAGMNLYDPATCARAAFTVYTDAGRSFRPWSTYTSGLYLPFVGQAMKAVAEASYTNDLPQQDAGSALSNLPGVSQLVTLGDLLTAIGKAGAWVANPHHWVRVLEVVAGAVGVIVALLIISGDVSSLGQIIPRPAAAPGASA